MFDVIDGLGIEDVVLCMEVDWSLGLFMSDFKMYNVYVEIE